MASDKAREVCQVSKSNMAAVSTLHPKTNSTADALWCTYLPLAAVQEEAEQLLHAADDSDTEEKPKSTTTVAVKLAVLDQETGVWIPLYKTKDGYTTDGLTQKYASDGEDDDDDDENVTVASLAYE